MKDNEIDALLEGFGWATLFMVDPECRPYAIEFSYFLENGGQSVHGKADT